jgi:hypothetical protein
VIPTGTAAAGPCEDGGRRDNDGLVTSDDQPDPPVVGPLDFASSKATDDVAATIAWLTDRGFEVSRESGPPYTSFGFLVEMVGLGLHVRLTLDRAQWMVDLGYSGEELVGLHVLVTAMDGSEAGTPEKRSLEDPLPVQLPDGVLWSVEVPAVVEWLVAGDRRREIQRASASWRQAMVRYWKQ